MEFLIQLTTEVVSKLGDLVVGSTLKRFKYLIHHEKILANLKEKHDNLKDAQQEFQQRVDLEERNGHEIIPIVKKWLSKVEAIENELRFYENEVNQKKKCFGGKCPDLAFNYSLGKQATEMVEKVISLLKEKQDEFHEISFPKAPPRLGSTFTEDIKSFKSREKIVIEVKEKLRDEKFKRIGICGMGGVGKTTLVKKLIKDIEASKLFDEVAMAVVSQNPEYEKIQAQIADNLGLRFEQESGKGRAMKLHERLNQANRSILIVLDDVWAMLDFERIGIPSQEPHKGCKILFTSRDEKVCEKMGSQKNFVISGLFEDEAWYLFKEIAGDVVGKPNIHPIAKQVAKECGGLPLAIAIIGKALANEEIHIWEDALIQLRNSQSSSSFKDVHELVYSRVELSIRFLDSEEHKFILFLCSLFPEDFDIPIESLLRHAMGLELFKDIDSLRKARNRVHNLVDKLTRCFLLLESDKPGFVRMHDVVRDVVISIASRVEHGFTVLIESTGGITALMKKLKEDKLNHLKAISLILDETIESQDVLECPTLQLLQVQSIGKEQNLWLPETFFKGSMTKPKVLAMRNLQIPQKQPLFFQASINLHTLRVENCFNVEDVSVIGKQLVNLEILSFAHSDIKEIPVDIGQLSSLRLLDLTGCDNLNFISTNVFSRLSRLEELYFRIINFPWKRNHAIIPELQSIISHQLKVIEMKVREARILAEKLDLDYNKLEKFWVYVAPYTYLQQSTYLESNLLQVTAADYNSIKCNGMIMQLVKKCETLILSKIKGLKNVANELDDCGFQCLNDLILESCPSIECLVDSTANCNALFPQIQSLSLKKLDNLTEICSNSFDVKESSMIQFSNLMKMELIDLPSLIGFSKAIGGLNELQPENAGKLLSESHSKPNTGDRSLSASVKLLFSTNWMHQFPKLQTLLLQNCASLDTLFDLQENSELDSYIFPQLKDIKIIGLNHLRQVWRSKTSYNVRCFQNLRSLTISFCDSLRHAFTPAIVRAIKLEKLEIETCKLMKTLAIDDEDDEEHEDKTKEKVILFDKLDSLKLSTLSSIESLCANSYELELSSLRKLKICDCPKLNIRFLFPQAYEKQNNLSATSHSTVHGTNYEENYSKSCNWHCGCTPLCSKLISHSNINKKSNKTALLPHDLVPSNLKKRNTKEEMGLMPILEELDVRNCDIQDEIGTSLSLVIVGHLFPNLKTLSMQNCNKASILLSPSTSRCLEHLENLHLQDCEDIEEIVIQEETGSSANNIIFHRLQHLLLQGLPNLKAFCQGSYNFDFPSLQKVKIKYCPNMKAFSQGSSLTPKLEDLTVQTETCITNYIHKKDLNATLQAFNVFVALSGTSKLRWTELQNEGVFGRLIDQNSTMNIHKFREISTVIPVDEIHVLQLQRVRGLNIYDCDSLIEVFESEEEGRGVGEKHLQGDDATTPTIQYELERMVLIHLPKLRHIWKHNMTGLVSRFGKLRSIRIQECDSLKSLLSYSMATSLVQLEFLEVGYCRMMEKVVRKEDHEKGGGSKVKILFPRLKSLYLYFLPELEFVCSGDYGYDLPLCDDKEMNNNTILQISFPQLEDLWLKDLPKLKCFSSGAYDYGIVLSGCCEEFVIEECPKITTVHHPRARASVTVTTPNLQLVRWNWNDIRMLGDLNSTIRYIQNSEKYKVELQKLETLKGIDELGGLCGYISRQTELVLEHCDKLLNCFPSDLITRHFLSHLKTLTVLECASLKEICESNDDDDIYDSGRRDHNSTTMMQLRCIRLDSLPKLKHIWKNHHDMIFFGFHLTQVRIIECHDLKYVFPDVSVVISLPNLYHLEVRECNKMEEIFHHNISNSNDDHHINDSNSRRSDNTSTTSTKMPYELKYIRLHSLPKLKHIRRNHHDIIIFGVHNLTHVQISECHDLRYVFPDVYVVASLLYLQSLQVRKCNKMEEIFHHNISYSIQQPAAAKEKEKEKEAKIIFPSLSSITLEKLPNLICFNPSSCYLELPFCYDIRIRKCPKMEAFSYEEGTVYTPSLVSLFVENSEFDCDEDVNEVIRRCKGKVIMN